MMKTVGLVLLMLLKILGWALLVLLLFALAVLLLVFFVPVRYRIAVHNGEAYAPDLPTGSTGKDGLLQNFRAHIRVTWLLHFFCFSLAYDSNAEGIDNSIRVAGIDLQKVFSWFQKHKAARQRRKPKAQNGSMDEDETHGTDDMPMGAASEDGTCAQETPGSPASTDQAPKTDAEVNDGASFSGKEASPEKTGPEKKSRKPKAAKENAQTSKSRGSGINGKFGSVKNKFAKFRTEFTDETNRSSVAHLWKEVCFLLRSYKPKKLKADITFSLADPAVTGGVLGMISLLPLIYRYPCKIMPDFVSEKLYAEGELMAEGKVTVFLFLVSLLRLIRDKNIRQSMRKLQGN